MKFLIASFLILSSSVAMASTCEVEALDAYTKALPQNDWHALTGLSYSLKAGKNKVELYGRNFKLNYPVDTTLLFASSEFMAGLGVEVIAVDADCNVLEIFNVYEE